MGSLFRDIAVSPVGNHREYGKSGKGTNVGALIPVISPTSPRIPPTVAFHAVRWADASGIEGEILIGTTGQVLSGRVGGLAGMVGGFFRIQWANWTGILTQGRNYFTLEDLQSFLTKDRVDSMDEIIRMAKGKGV
jgi:hypothetical protein